MVTILITMTGRGSCEFEELGGSESRRAWPGHGQVWDYIGEDSNLLLLVLETVRWAPTRLDPEGHHNVSVVVLESCNQHEDNYAVVPGTTLFYSEKHVRRHFRRVS